MSTTHFQNKVQIQDALIQTINNNILTGDSTTGSSIVGAIKLFYFS